MGIFGFGSKKTEAAPATAPTPAPAATLSLDLTKGQLLDLTKAAPGLENVDVGAGWNPAKHGKSFDLDLCAYLYNGNGALVDTVYFGDKRSQGIFLNGDNLTGDGDGDDEVISCDLKAIKGDVKKIVFGVVIYHGSSKRQNFSMVNDAFIRLVDKRNGSEICRFNMTESGGDATAVAAAALEKNGDVWSFRGIEEYSQDTVDSLGRKCSSY